MTDPFGVSKGVKPKNLLALRRVGRKDPFSRAGKYGAAKWRVRAYGDQQAKQAMSQASRTSRPLRDRERAKGY